MESVQIGDGRLMLWRELRIPQGSVLPDDRCWREGIEARQLIGDFEPGCLGADEHIEARAEARIVVERAHRESQRCRVVIEQAHQS
jgi:hypothetical protein